MGSSLCANWYLQLDVKHTHNPPITDWIEQCRGNTLELTVLAVLPS
jgi:hypothetical protein